MALDVYECQFYCGPAVGPPAPRYRVGMNYSPLDGPDTALAGFAHLGAIVGPIIPWLVWRSRRDEDPFVAREAAKATNAGMAFLLSLIHI